jgi:hypothetical protein
VWPCVGGVHLSLEFGLVCLLKQPSLVFSATVLWNGRPVHLVLLATLSRKIRLHLGEQSDKMEPHVRF